MHVQARSLECSFLSKPRFKGPWVAAMPLEYLQGGAFVKLGLVKVPDHEVALQRSRSIHEIADLLVESSA